MNVFYFGDSQRQLYGVLHTPRVEAPTPKAVLLCYPFGHEYMLAHRAYRQLAMLLTRIGYSVLRFDYRGTGDSSGELDSIGFEDWLDDIEIAVNELQQVTGAKKVDIVGLRLGALTATCTALKLGTDIVDRVVLWDPVLSGLAYEKELIDYIESQTDRQGFFVDANQGLQSNGFYMNPGFLRALKEIDLVKLAPEFRGVLHIVSEATEHSEQLKNAWRDSPCYEFRHTPAPGDWNYVDVYGSILLPQPVIQGIVEWIANTEA